MEGHRRPMHTGAIGEIKKPGTEKSTAVRHLFQRLSILIRRGNSALLVNRAPENGLIQDW